MNLPTHHQDVWIPATDSDKLKALALLGGLPSRQSASVEIDEAGFALALDGVTKHGLTEAVKAILRGALDHGFFPSPPELRIQCDKAMQFHREMQERIHRRERMESDAPKPKPPLTPEQRARSEALMRRFHEAYANGEASEKAALEAAERAEVRTRYGLTDEVLAAMPDRPLAKTWTQPGGKSAA